MNEAVQIVNRSAYLETVKQLFNDGYNFCVDVTSVDYLNEPELAPKLNDKKSERFLVVCNLLSHSNRSRVRLLVPVPDTDPTIDSIVELYPGAENMEREVYDLMGIVFLGHPDLTRILMPDDWLGHPLRKDYEVGAVPVQFKYPSEEYDTTR